MVKLVVTDCSRRRRDCSRRRRGGFTLVELLVVVAVLAVLAVIATMSTRAVIAGAQKAVCSQSLRNLGRVVQQYSADHGQRFPTYVEYGNEGTMWYFGYEQGRGGSEGDRRLLAEQGPLYPYLNGVGTVEVCPAFDYGAALYKPKFQGASWGYGYAWELGGKLSGRGGAWRVTRVEDAGRTVLFADCAQVNTFQAPASPSKPMLEEFYILDASMDTVHFRHRGKAMAVFVDGHVGEFEPSAQLDERLEGELVGRLPDELYP